MKMGVMSSDGKICVLFFFFMFCVDIIFAESLNLYSFYIFVMCMIKGQSCQKGRDVVE